MEVGPVCDRSTFGWRRSWKSAGSPHVRGVDGEPVRVSRRMQDVRYDAPWPVYPLYPPSTTYLTRTVHKQLDDTALLGRRGR